MVCAEEKVIPSSLLATRDALSSCKVFRTDFGAFYYVEDADTLYVIQIEEEYKSMFEFKFILEQIILIARDHHKRFIQYLTHRRPVIRIAEQIIKDKVKIVGYLVKVEVS